MHQGFDDPVPADFPPPPPEFADESLQQQQPHTLPPHSQVGSTFRAYSVVEARSSVTEDKKFLDDYFCNLTRNEALDALEAVQMDGAYIVRPGSGSPYCISFLHGGETKHVKIQRNSSGKFFLGETKIEMLFDTMSQLMDYLTKNVIQGVNGVVFRLIINAKSYSQSLRSNRSQLKSSSIGSPHPQYPAQHPSLAPSPPPQPIPQSPPVYSPNSNGGSAMPRRGSTFAPSGGGGGDIMGSTLPGRPLSRGSFSSGLAAAQQLDTPAPIRPLTQQRYFAELRRDEAEAHLMNTRIEGQFLVRPSKASAYCLSVFHRGRVVHLKIICASNRFVLEQLLNDGQTFANVPDLIDSLALNRRTLTLMNGDSIVLRSID